MDGWLWIMLDDVHLWLITPALLYPYPCYLYHHNTYCTFISQP